MVALDDELRQALSKLGPVKHIVSPNYEHVKYASQWAEAYPDARTYACPGLPERIPSVNWSLELGSGAENPPEWLGEIEAAWLGYEQNPFNGKPFFNEVVFVYKPGGVLITSDLFWNYPRQGTSTGTKLWKFGMDRVYAPFYRNFMIKDKGECTAVMRRIFDDWEWDKILPCHGDFVPADGKKVLREHLSFCL